VAAVVVADDERSRDIETRHYDPIARHFIAAFRKIMPGLSRPDAVWAYLFAHGARIQAYSQSGRYQRLNGSRSRPSDKTTVEDLKKFTAAGIRALCKERVAAAKPIK
jgi:hypothetical protein